MAASILTPEESAEVEDVRGLVRIACKDSIYYEHGTLLLRIIDRLSASPWRPVTEAEPARGDRWLVLLEDGTEGPEIMWRLEPSETRCDRWAWDDFEKREAFCVPSHWMPLPSVPGGGRRRGKSRHCSTGCGPSPRA